MKHSIGIDFGTTKTMVSFLNPTTGRPELVNLGRKGDPPIPTTIYVDESGEFLYGEEANDQIETDPEGYCRAFKLHLGETEPVLSRAGETAESLATRFLRHIKEQCEQTVPAFYGETIDTATITIPVKFSPARKESLKRAAEAAGFASVSFVPEPEAAGTAFLRDNPTDKFSRALVLDWGGGTLDIAIISRDENGGIHADRHCAEGRDDVGGEEMDRRLLVELDSVWSKTFGDPLVQAEEQESKFLREVEERIKIALSSKDTAIYRHGPKKVNVSREQFHKLIDGMLDDAVQLVQAALAKNRKRGIPDPDAILLIGGTCLCPAVRETLEKNFPGLRVLSWHNARTAVALGATSVWDEKTENHAKFNAKYDWLKSTAFPTVGPQTNFYQLPDGGWQMDCGDNPWNNAAIAIRPGETEPHEVHGAICSRWYAEGGAFNERKEPGWLGHPVSDEEIYMGDGDPNDRISHFENGYIVWKEQANETRVFTVQIGAANVPSDIIVKFQDKYDWLKNKQFPSIGDPDSDGIHQIADGIWTCHYGNTANPDWCGCTIVVRAGNAETREVHGKICERWLQEGGACSWLGYPTSDEDEFTDDGDPRDRISKFENGHIVWKEQAQETRVINVKDPLALFKRKYDELRAGPYPQIGQPNAPYQLPDGGWQMDCGNWAAITLRPGTTTPYAVTGRICERWYAEGGVYNEKMEKGRLGHPTSDEVKISSGPYTKVSHFEHGRIYWNPSIPSADVDVDMGSPNAISNSAWIPVKPSLPASSSTLPKPLIPSNVTISESARDSETLKEWRRRMTFKEAGREIGSCVLVPGSKRDWEEAADTVAKTLNDILRFFS